MGGRPKGNPGVGKKGKRGIVGAREQGGRRDSRGDTGQREWDTRLGIQ